MINKNYRDRRKNGQKKNVCGTLMFMVLMSDWTQQDFYINAADDEDNAWPWLVSRKAISLSTGNTIFLAA